MTTSGIEIEGLDAAIRKLTAIGRLDAVKTGMKEAAEHVKGKLGPSNYPPQKHLPQPFKTDKSRRFFFAALADGRINVPYRRGQKPQSEDLGQSWTIKARKGGLQWVVGNNVSYGPLVQGDEQTGYMKAVGWKNTDQVAKAESAAVNKILAAAIEKALK